MEKFDFPSHCCHLLLMEVIDLLLCLIYHGYVLDCICAIIMSIGLTLLLEGGKRDEQESCIKTSVS